MSEIDITSSGFSLDVPAIPEISEVIPDIQDIISNIIIQDKCPASYDDYTIYIYIGMFVFFLVSAGILYQLYIFKHNK